MPHVADDADDRSRRHLRARGVRADANSLTDGIAAEACGERLVDEDRLRGIAHVLWSEQASALQRYPHRREPPRRDGVTKRVTHEDRVRRIAWGGFHDEAVSTI